MDYADVRTHIRLSSIEVDVKASNYLPSYLWTIFFKIDGDTVYVGEDLMLHGSATVVGTPGDHGDLPGNGALSNVAIPSQLGEFRTVLTPIPIRFVSGINVPGVVGCVAILLLEEDTPADAVAQGHQALNSSLQNALDAEISKLGVNNQNITDADVKAITEQVTNAVKKAITNSLSTWEQIVTWLGFENQDNLIGTAIYRFNAQNDLADSAPQGISLQNGYPDPSPIVYTFQVSAFPIIIGESVWTFHGTIIGDPLPISLRRVLVGLGYQQPLPGVREAMGTHLVKSLRAWIDAVR